MMAAYALDAVDPTKRAMRVDLDISPASVREVESILATMFEAKPRGFLSRLLSQGPSPEALESFTQMHGASGGEILRRADGGEWSVDTEVAPGDQEIGLRHRFRDLGC